MRGKTDGQQAPAVLPFQGTPVERAVEAAASMVVAWIGENDPPLPDDSAGRPDDPSRLVPRTPCDARIVIRDGGGDASQSVPTAEGDPSVEAHRNVWASWIRAVRDGLVSVSDLVRANLLGHRLYYLGCLDGDVADLAALRGCFDYHLAAYERELVGNAGLETLLIAGDGDRRWFFCGHPWESDGGEEGWLGGAGRVLGLPDWVMTYTSGEIAGDDGKWHPSVAAQAFVPSLLAYHATLRTASGESRGDLPNPNLDDVSNAMRSSACLSALGATAAAWMDCPDGDIPDLDAVAALGRHRVQKFDVGGQQAEWFDPVVIEPRTWQGVAPIIRGMAASLREAGLMCDDR